MHPFARFEYHCGKHRNHRKQHPGVRARVAVLPAHKRTVNFYSHEIQRVAYARAVFAAHEKRGGGLQTAYNARNEVVEYYRGRERHGNVYEPLKGVRAVQLCALVQSNVYILKRREPNYHTAAQAPQAHEYHGSHRG